MNWIAIGFVASAAVTGFGVGVVMDAYRDYAIGPIWAKAMMGVVVGLYGIAFYAAGAHQWF